MYWLSIRAAVLSVQMDWTPLRARHLRIGVVVQIYAVPFSWIILSEFQNDAAEADIRVETGRRTAVSILQLC
jgi:hypothetical protein